MVLFIDSSAVSNTKILYGPYKCGIPHGDQPHQETLARSGVSHVFINNVSEESASAFMSPPSQPNTIDMCTF